MKNMIKMYYWGLICCFFSFCWACTDDSEDVNSTDLDIDWFVVEDSENPIDHLIYTVYEKYGVPIYFLQGVTAGVHDFFSYIHFDNKESG